MNSASSNCDQNSSLASTARRDPTESGTAGNPIRHVGVVGLGHMGEAFARNLIADGYELTAYDLSKARRDLLASAGARAVSDLAGLAGCEVVLTSLPNDQILSDVTLGAGGLVACLAPGAIHISTSTRQSRPSSASLPGSREGSSGICRRPGARQPGSRPRAETFRHHLWQGIVREPGFAAARATGAARVPIRQRSRCRQPDEVSRQCPDGADAGRHGGSPRVAAQERYRRPRRVRCPHQFAVRWQSA